MATNSATMATRSSTKCPWRKFYKHITKYMNILHTEACKPQEKIAKLVYAITYHFASPIVDLEQNKKSTKQMQTTEQPRRMTQDPSSSTKRTANTETIDTDSAYSTDTESSYTPQMENTKFSSLQDHTKNITRPSASSQSITILEEEISSTSTRTHPAPPPRPSKGQQITNTKCIQGTKPLHVPIPTKSNSKTSHRSTSTHQPKPSTSTWSNTETTIKQPTVPVTRTSSASTYPQRMRKTPLLPTPPVQARQFYNRNHYNQHISGPSPPRYSTYSAFSRPATLNNYRYYLQPPFQDQILHFHCTCTKNSSQDHTNRHHYYHFQHLQDHINRCQDTFHNKYTIFQSYYHTLYNTTPYEERRQKHRLL